MMSPAPAKPTFPLFASGLIEDDGRVTGCWFVDGHSLLVGGKGVSVEDRIVWVTRIRDGVPHVHGVQGKSGGDPPRPVEMDPGEDAQGLFSLSMQHFLLMVAGVDGALSDPSGRDGGALRRRCAVVHPHVASGESLNDLVTRARAGLAVARNGIAPFVDALDGFAVAVATGVLGPDAKSWASRTPWPLTDRDYAGLDASLDPEAPLARAWSTAPGFENLSAAVLRNDPAAFGVAVRGGPSRLDAALRHHAEALCGAGPRLWATARSAATHATRTVAGRRATPPEAGRATSDHALVHARLLSSLPADWTPADVHGWSDLEACAPALAWVDDACPPDLRGTCLNAKGDWHGFRRRLVAAHGRPDDGKALSLALDDVADVTVAYADQVLVPAFASAGGTSARLTGKAFREFARGAARVLLLSGRSACRVLEASRRWHSHQHGMLAAMPRPDGLDGVTRDWPATLPDARYRDVAVTVLTTRTSLADEGARGEDGDGVGGLKHCVGGYAGRCLRGECRILSIRGPGPDGIPTRLSTAEVTLKGARPTVAQHRGRGNSEPPEAARAALDAYVRDIGSGALPLDDPHLPRVPGADPVSEAAGYDVTAPGNWEAVRSSWDPHVPRGLRGIDQGTLVGLASLPRLVTAQGWWRAEPFSRADLAGAAATDARRPGP